MGQIVQDFFLLLHLAALEEGRRLLENRAVLRASQVPAHGVGKPEVVVGDVGPHAPAGGGMPPMLDVALGELPRRHAEEVFARYPVVAELVGSE